MAPSSSEILFDQLQARDRGALARAITLVESTRFSDSAAATELLNLSYKKRADSIRVGITGVPGVGKSTFIDALGMLLIEQGKRVAVLAIDPTSERSGGSILGDKTRMDRLSREENAFIRPSASRLHLGGVALATQKNILLLEAAGFDVILIETVGVGQSETEVSHLVDFNLLMLLPGGGDELQGIKRGVMELANGIIVNKADLMADEAKKTCAEYKTALHIMQPLIEGWFPTVLPVSAETGDGLAQCWESIEAFKEIQVSKGRFEANRQLQYEDWLRNSTMSQLLDAIGRRFDLQTELKNALEAFQSQGLSPFAAQQSVIQNILSQLPD
jgi:LAO/AO transport system kinase